MAGTLAPSPWFTGLDTNGRPYAAGKLYTYAAGTTNNQATYNNADLDPAHANANPIILDAAGRCVIYLSATSYRFDLYTSTGALVRTQDNIAAVPLASGNTDITVTAGEALSAGTAAYESDGSGGKTGGLWYKGDQANNYSSATPNVGMVVTDIALGATGTVRQTGTVTGMAGLIVAAPYYIGTAGALTSTPTAHARFLGWALSTTTLAVLVSPITQENVDQEITCGRLTLTSATPVTVTDVTAATTLYFALYRGNRIALFNGSIWILDAFSQLSSAVPSTTSTMYDAFIYDNAGTPTLELLAWTNDTTRATALTTQDGVLVKTGAVTRKYIGSFRTTTVSGQTEDSVTKRYVWNYYNRLRRPLQRYESTSSWPYTTATIRQANGSAANQVDTVVGFAEATLDLVLSGVAVINTVAGTNVAVGIGIGSTTTATVAAWGSQAVNNTGTITLPACRLVITPPVGRQFYPWNEYSIAGGATTWYAALAVGMTQTAGLSGWIEG